MRASTGAGTAAGMLETLPQHRSLLKATLLRMHPLRSRRERLASCSGDRARFLPHRRPRTRLELLAGTGSTRLCCACEVRLTTPREGVSCDNDTRTGRSVDTRNGRTVPAAS